MLKIMKVVPKLATTTHARSASPEECAEWYERTMPEILRLLKEGFNICIGDAVIISMYRHAKARVYDKPGRLVIRTIPGNRDKEIIYSVITADRLKMSCRCPDTKTPSVVDFLTRVMNRFGKAVVLMDRASSHRSAEVMQLLEENMDRLRVIEFPTASPHLSAIETWWAIMRATFEDMYEFDTIEEKMDAIMEYLRTAPVNLDIFKFLENAKKM